MKIIRKISIIAYLAVLVLIILNLMIHIRRTKEYNERIHTITIKGSTKSNFIDIHPRGGNADAWEKVDVTVNGKVCTLKGITYDCVFSNYSDYLIEDWTVRIDITQDCYINNAWCGTVEIHQLSGMEDRTQTLDLRNFSRDNVWLSYITVGQDVLIALHKGDYIIYHPDLKAQESPVPSAIYGTPGSVTTGMIFYYLKTPDLDISISDYSGKFHFNKSYWQGTEPKIFIIMMSLWGFIAIIWISIIVSYRKAKSVTEKEMAIQRVKELEESNAIIRAVSDIYYIIYKVDVPSDRFEGIKVNPIISNFTKRYSSASEALKALPDIMFVEKDSEKIRPFFNLDVWQEHLKNKDNEYLECRGKFTGWIRVNIIVSKRDKLGNAVQIICALQDVNKMLKEEQERKQRLEEANRIMMSYNEELNASVAEQTIHIKEIQEKVVRGLANVIGNRDMDTVGHVNRTSDIISIIVEEYRKQHEGVISSQKASDIVRAAPMHDLGKIYIDTSILCKPGRFTDEEYEKMKTHSSYSGDIVNFVLKDVEESHFVNVAFNVARFHHERWDGKGYPDKLAGEEIPLESRLMAIADVYDALVSKRCYKQSMGFEKAYSIMIEGMGTQFDPEMKSVFEACRPKLEEYYTKTGSV